MAAGRVARAEGAAPVTAETLFRIGSITRSFAAAALLRLKAEGRLDRDQTLGDWLPQCPDRAEVSIRRLLDRTSGIVTSEDLGAMTGEFVARGLSWRYAPVALVGFFDPTYPGPPKPTSGYDCSDANDVLAGMVLARAGGHG